MKKLVAGQKYRVFWVDSVQDVIIDSDDGGGWYTAKDLAEIEHLEVLRLLNLPEEVRPFALNLNLAKSVREWGGDWDQDDDSH